jgi:flagellin
MGLYINTNIGSLNAQNNLNSSQMSLQTSLQRLSSGLRINSAKDDAAGLAISTRMTSQINGLSQASQNANDGISLSQTAEGGMSTIADNLQRMRSLAVQAANGSNSASDRASIQAEISQLQQNINQVATQTQFNGMNLLDGTLNNAQFQIGANANQVINFSVGNASANAIGSNILSTASGTSQYDTTVNAMTQSVLYSATALGATTLNNFAAQSLTITGNGSTVVVPSSTLVAGASAQLVASSINAAAGSTGVSATASTTSTLGNFTASGAVSLTLQGNPTSAGAANPVTINANMANTKDVSGLAAAINAQSGATGITAIADTVNGKITLSNAQGYDIGVTNLAASAGSFDVTGTVSGQAAGVGVSAAGVGAGTAKTLTNAGDSAVVGGQVSFSSATSYTISSNLGAGASHLIAGGTAAGSSLSAVGAIDVTAMTGQTPTGANAALSVIDAALLNINNQEAAMGAIQNRFTSVISNLATSGQNLTSARSLIQDTNYASETANLTRSQILQQAGTAMLAQANSVPNGVMTLLK